MTSKGKYKAESNAVRDTHDDEGGDALSKADTLAVLKCIVAERKPAMHHIESFNELLSIGIPSIIKQGFAVQRRIKNKRTSTPADTEISEFVYSLTFNDARLSQPVRHDSSLGSIANRMAKSGNGASVADVDSATGSATDLALLPNTARNLERTYSATLRIDADITVKAIKAQGQAIVRTEHVKNLRIGAIPCMVGCTHCHLYGKSRQELIELGEDPNDAQGYFILKGGEWSLDVIENVTTNDIRITTEHAGREVARAQIWCKAGDNFENSYQCIVRLMENGAIYIEFQYASQIKLNIPFQIFFRLLADITDLGIAEMIIGDITQKDALTSTLNSLIDRAFMAPIEEDNGAPYKELRYIMEHVEVAKAIGAHVNELNKNAAAEKDIDVLRTVYTSMMNAVDIRVVPHIGLRPQDRVRKQQYLGYVICKMLMTYIGILSPLDRDSLKSKRMHPAGLALAKSFKTRFNRVVVIPIAKHIESTLEATTFMEANLHSAVTSAIKPDDLESTLTRSITAGNTTVELMRRAVPNRISSQQRTLKSDANMLSIAGTISVANVMSNKQNERADMIRRVHSTYIGYIDPSQSADSGEKVGMSKQLAITTVISKAVSSDGLRQVLEYEEGGASGSAALITNISTKEIGRQGLTRIFVNGNWIGCCAEDHKFVARWRAHRRVPDSSLIDKHTSIYWDPRAREVQFWTDYGRMLRPLLIVYNNYEEYDARCREAFAAGKPLPDRSEFRQWIKLTRDHITKIQRREMNLATLIKEGVMEFIAADESENMYIAPNIDVLRNNKNNLCASYTHCEIEQAIFGPLTLAAPLVNHSYAYRVTLYTCHRKQFCTWYALNFPYRIDKQAILQYYCERPLVSCFSDDFLNPSGHNCVVAIMLYSGYNQQDSLIANLSSVQRGLFNGSFFDYTESKREKGEVFALPKDQIVVDRHSDAVADFLEDGIAKVGTVLQRNYIIIAKTATSGERRATGAASGTAPSVDKSSIYTSRTPAYVMRVIHDETDKKIEFVRVKWRQPKNLIRGDKCGSRTGNKGIVARLEPACNLPYTEEGVVPDIIVNAQSIPTRRALNQLIESVMGEYGAEIGCHVDATSFLPINVDAIIRELNAKGFKYAGYRRMYNGNTGDWINLPICVGPTSYQRLQKFADNESYAVRHGPTNAVTHQPIRGRREGGSCRLGEMEQAVLATHGTARAMSAKLFEDSDGTKIHVCSRCSNRAVFNTEDDIYRCNFCGEMANIVAVPSCWASNLYQHEVRALGIKMDFEIEPRQFNKMLDE